MNLEDFDLEIRIKEFESKVVYGILTSAGLISDKAIIRYLIQDRKANAKYRRLMHEYYEIQSHPGYTRKFGRVAKQKTIDDLKLYSGYLVRPIRPERDDMINSVLIGKVLKMPSDSTQYEPGDEWKAALNKAPEINVGDVIYYIYKHHIILDGEKLHVVNFVEGKKLD